MKKIIAIVTALVVMVASIPVHVTVIADEHSIETVTKQHITFRDCYGYGDGEVIVTDDGNIWGYDSVYGDCCVTLSDNATPNDVTDDTIVAVTPRFYAMSVENRDEYGDIVVEFNDGSWAVINRNAKECIFQPWVMGDYEYRFAPDTDGKWTTVRFVNCILTYCENMYGCDYGMIPDVNGNDIVAEMIGKNEAASYYEHMYEVRNLLDDAL